MPTDLRADVAAASASYLFNLLPALVTLPANEAYERLAAHFEAAIAAYCDGRAGWPPAEPSDN